MRERGMTASLLGMERLGYVRAVAVAVAVGSAAMTVLGGMLFKSHRWTGTVDGQGMGWSDGVKPWVGWAFLGGLAALVLLAVAWWSERWSIVTPVGAAYLLWRAGSEATARREAMEHFA